MLSWQRLHILRNSCALLWGAYITFGILSSLQGIDRKNHYTNNEGSRGQEKNGWTPPTIRVTLLVIMLYLYDLLLHMNTQSEHDTSIITIYLSPWRRAARPYVHRTDRWYMSVTREHEKTKRQAFHSSLLFFHGFGIKFCPNTSSLRPHLTRSCRIDHRSKAPDDRYGGHQKSTVRTAILDYQRNFFSVPCKLPSRSVAVRNSVDPICDPAQLAWQQNCSTSKT